MNIANILATGQSYDEYRLLIEKLISEGKTTGVIQSEVLTNFTKLNIQRMNRLDKTVELPSNISDMLQSISRPLTLLLVGEAWCGDCAQIIPIVT